jgi:hypothetical protein
VEGKLVTTVSTTSVVITNAMMTAAGAGTIEAQKSYKFSIVSVDKSGNSDINNKKTFVTGSVKTPKYAAPKVKVVKDSLTLSSVTVDIGARPTGETLTMQVEQGKNNWVTFSNFTLAGNLLTITGLTPSMKYKFRIEGTTNGEKTPKPTTFSVSPLKVGQPKVSRVVNVSTMSAGIKWTNPNASKTVSLTGTTAITGFVVSYWNGTAWMAADASDFVESFGSLNKTPKWVNTLTLSSQGESKLTALGMATVQVKVDLVFAGVQTNFAKGSKIKLT